MYTKRTGTNQIIKKTTPEAEGLGEITFKFPTHDKKLVEFSVKELTLLFALDSCFKNPCQDSKQKAAVKDFWSERTNKTQRQELYKRYFKNAGEMNGDLSEMIEDICSKLDLKQHSPTYIFECLCCNVSLQQGITQDQLNAIIPYILYYFAEKLVVEDFLIVDALTNEKSFAKQCEELLFKLIKEKYRQIKLDTCKQNMTQKQGMQTQIANTFIDEACKENPVPAIEKSEQAELPLERSQFPYQQLLAQHFPDTMEAVCKALLPYVPIIPELTKIEADDKKLTREVIIPALQRQGFIGDASGDKAEDKIQMTAPKGKTTLSIDIKKMIELEEELIRKFAENTIESLQTSLKTNKDCSIKDTTSVLSRKEDDTVIKDIISMLEFTANVRRASETIVSFKTEQSEYNARIQPSKPDQRDISAKWKEVIQQTFLCDSTGSFDVNKIETAMTEQYRKMYPGNTLTNEKVSPLIYTLTNESKNSKCKKSMATPQDVKEQYGRINTTGIATAMSTLEESILRIPEFILHKGSNKYANKLNTTYNDAFKLPIARKHMETTTLKRDNTEIKKSVESISHERDSIVITILTEHEQSKVILIYQLSTTAIKRIVTTFINELPNLCCTQAKSLRKSLDQQFESAVKSHSKELKALGLTEKSILGIIKSEKLYKIYSQCNTTESPRHMTIETLLSHISTIALPDEHSEAKNCAEENPKQSCIKQFTSKITEELQKEIRKLRTGNALDPKNSEISKAIRLMSECAYIYCDIENVLQKAQEVGQQALTAFHQAKELDQVQPPSKPASSLSSVAVASEESSRDTGQFSSSSMQKTGSSTRYRK